MLAADTTFVCFLALLKKFELEFSWSVALQMRVLTLNAACSQNEEVSDLNIFSSSVSHKQGSVTNWTFSFKLSLEIGSPVCPGLDCEICRQNSRHCVE